MDEQQRKELARQRLQERRARNAGTAPQRTGGDGGASQQRTGDSAAQRSATRTSKRQSAQSRTSRTARQTDTHARTDRQVNAPTYAESSLALLAGTIELPVVGTISRKLALGALVALIVFVLVIAFAVRGCTSPASSGSSSAAASSASASSASAASDDPSAGEPDFDGLASFIGDDLAQVLVDQAETNEDIRWITTHVDAYGIEDWDVQAKILKLAATDPYSISYVRHFPDDYPADDQALDASLALDDGLSGTSFETNVPHLYQWDRRWAYCVYSSTTFGLTGCGPTCMAMVSQALTGSDLTPWDMGVRARDNGFMATFEGTDTAFFYHEAGVEGFSCWAIPAGEDYIREALSNGQVIIANLGPGYFTQYGHFFVLAGLDSDGNVIVNDPYSVVRSSQTWDPAFIASQAIGLYAFSW